MKTSKYGFQILVTDHNSSDFKMKTKNQFLVIKNGVPNEFWENWVNDLRHVYHHINTSYLLLEIGNRKYMLVDETN